MLSIFSSHHSSSCLPSGIIFAGASKFPFFNLREVTLSFTNNDKREVQVLQITKNDSPNDFYQIPNSRFISS